ncbi:MAG: hypothetical protein NDI90_05855 [Nitrospira sp. BO4]|jgi:hypothetical protein|nr:hypothetical protein [Nitrospira sp. BO4]
MNKHVERLKEIHTILNSLTSSPYSHDVIELALATATSLPICAGEHPAPIWLLIAGAPSSGKTEGVLLLKGAPNVTYLDAMTENSFVSGYIDKKTGQGPAQQLLTDLDEKCLIVKDLTTIFSMRDDRVRKILGDFQSIYDGEYAKATGTLGLKSFQSTFGMMACITPLALHKHHTYMSMVGGRFLVIRLLPLTDEEREAGFERAWDEEARRQKLPHLRRLLIEHVECLLKEPVAMEPETAEQREQLNKLALLLARGRGVILTEKVQDLDEDTGQERYAYETANVQIEEPYRALEQLKNLGRALARIHGRPGITDHEMELLRRVVLSSVAPSRGDALACFRRYPSGLTAKVLTGELKKGETRVRALLQELVALRLVVEHKNVTGWTYKPVPELVDLITKEVRVLDHVVDLDNVKLSSQNSPPTYSLIST